MGSHDAISIPARGNFKGMPAETLRGGARDPTAATAVAGQYPMIVSMLKQFTLMDYCNRQSDPSVLAAKLVPYALTPSQSFFRKIKDEFPLCRRITAEAIVLLEWISTFRQ